MENEHRLHESYRFTSKIRMETLNLVKKGVSAAY